jgi:hypothetical protein
MVVDNVSGIVRINCRAAYAESVTVVLMLSVSISIRNADSLGTCQYCVGDWPDEMVYLIKCLEQCLELVQINSISEESLTSYLANIQAQLIR